MASKSDFSVEEWGLLRDAPHFVVVAVASAGGSGLFGSLKEALAPAGAMIEALKGDNALLRDVCQKDEMKAAVESLKDMTKSTTDYEALKAFFRNGATEKSRAALDLLKKKGAPGDASAYADFLMNLGNRVANAAKEGSFLGFGGERVSEHERTLLAELAQTLGVQQA